MNNEFDFEFATSMQNRARVVKELRKKGLPINGWKCVDWEDTRSATSTCQLCGFTKVRFLHHMYNEITGDRLNVGCICAGGMEDNLYAAQERERIGTNRVERRKRFFSKEWDFYDEDGEEFYSLKYKHRRLELMQDFIDFFYYRINNSAWIGPYDTLDDAKEALFTAQDEMG